MSVRLHLLIAAWVAVCCYCTSSYANRISNHPCLRECDGGAPKRCVYHFDVEFYYTMSKACYDCPHNMTDCDRHHCIAADGVERGVVVINRQLPGPSIEVCEGDRIVVDVKNHLPGESTTLHWHGIHQIGTPYMDGVPLVTQCPITPASAFRYDFIADNPGTHFYHSHMGFQRADGVFGPLIVRQSRQMDPHSRLYDQDLSEHIIFVSDWLGELGVSKFVAHHHDDGDNKPTSMIINGKGRLPKPKSEITANETMPLSVFNVRQGQRYRFRVISNGFLNCPIQLSVDNHTLVIIASDGGPVQPLQVDSVVVHAGERYDFILNANQDISSYWIRLHGLMDCWFKQVYQEAILRYDGAPEEEPEGNLTYDNTKRSGKVLNPVNVAPGDENHVTSAELRAVSEASEDEKWTREPDHKFVLAYDFYAVNSYHFHDPEHYPIFGVEKNHRLFTPQLNRISLRMPPSPPLSQHEDVPSKMLCNHTTMAHCDKEFCDCTYTLQVELGSLVEVVLLDEGVTFDATHPFHIHGTAFRVVAMERLGSTITVEQFEARDRLGLVRRNLVDAPVKDTVAVPDGGYTIIRFMATNPGYWLFHCHLSFHIEVGMGLIFKVGEHHDFPPVPNKFPKCGSWLPPIEEEESHSQVEVSSAKPAVPDASTEKAEKAIPVEHYEENLIPYRLINGSLSHQETSSLRPISGSPSSLDGYLTHLSKALLIATCSFLLR